MILMFLILLTKNKYYDSSDDEFVIESLKLSTNIMMLRLQKTVLSNLLFDDFLDSRNEIHETKRVSISFFRINQNRLRSFFLRNDNRSQIEISFEN